jgi:hypothetical protein
MLANGLIKVELLWVVEFLIYDSDFMKRRGILSSNLDRRLQIRPSGFDETKGVCGF